MKLQGAISITQLKVALLKYVLGGSCFGQCLNGLNVWFLCEIEDRLTEFDCCTEAHATKFCSQWEIASNCVIAVTQCVVVFKVVSEMLFSNLKSLEL